ASARRRLRRPASFARPRAEAPPRLRPALRPRSRRRSGRGRVPRASAPSPLRLRRAWDLSNDSRSAAGRTLDLQSSAEGLYPICEPSQTGSFFGACAADSVVLDDDLDASVAPTRGDTRLRRVRVLRDVRQGLARDEVGGRLDG